MNVLSLVRNLALACGALLSSLAATPVMAQTGVDGIIGPEWSGPGVTIRTVTYDPGAPVGNFGTPGTTNSAVAYTTYFRADSTYIYAAVAANPAGGGSAAGVQFANLYFSSTLPNGSIGMEVTNNRFFRGGVFTGGPLNDGYYPAAGYATWISNVTNGVIEVAIPISFFRHDPLGMGFATATSQVRFNLSQSLGYSVAGGTDYNAPMGPDERLGLVQLPPEYSVELQSVNDCRHDGSFVANLVLTNAAPVSVAAGGQFFLSFDNGLAVNSIVAGPALMGVSLTFNNLSHTANVAVGAPFGNPTATLSPGQVLATITFTTPNTYCGQSGLVGFRANNPVTRLTDANGNAIAVATSALAAISLNDVTAPVITCPGNVSVTWADGKDPWATGFATATDNCDPAPVITFVDDRTGLTNCMGIGGRGTITRTWTATDHCGNASSCVQTITVTDSTPPVQTACPANIYQSADAGSCSAVINYTCPTAFEQQHFQGFENPGFVAGGPEITSPFNDSQSTDWNSSNSFVHRVVSGTDGVTSKSGAAHARIDSASLPASPDAYSGAYTRLGGYGSNFANGFIASQDVYINLADPAVAASTYGFDLDTAASNNAGGFLRDFIFHTAGQPGSVLVGADNNSSFARRNDLGSINHYAITSTGWYTFEWNFHNVGGVLAVDMNLRDASGTLLWTEVRSDPSDLIASVVGGNRYMWFTFIAADELHIDNTSLIRPVPVDCNPPSGSTFPSGATIVTASSVDACGNTTSCTFNVVVSNSNTMVATVEEAGLNLPSERCVTFEMWGAGCTPVATVSGNMAFNSTNTVDFESYAAGNLPGATSPTDLRTPGGTNWWLPSNCATSGQVAAGVGRSGSKGLVVGNNGSGNDGVIDNLKTPRLPFAAGETVSPVNAASSKFRSSYWFRTASTTPVDGFAFKSESYGPDRTTYFGTWYQTSYGDTNLNCGVYAIEDTVTGLDFVFHPVASNLAWGTWYRVQCDITFVNNGNNDVVDYRLYDSTNTLVGSALGLHDWEEGARQFGYNGGSIFGIDAVQFQTAGDYSAVGPRDVAYVDDITYSALPTILIDVPCGAPAFSSVTVTDTKHTLRRTGTGAPNFGVAGTSYYANFTAATGKALQQGNDNNDAYIDILDFGIYIGRIFQTPGGSTPCGYSLLGGYHPDFDGDGIVGVGDFTFIQSGFLNFRDPDPCGGALQGTGPVADISVDELVARDMRSATMADFNLDGRVNAADIAYVFQHGLPRCPADFNDDQVTDVSDIFSFLTAWFAGHPKADMNANNRTDVQDIFSFLEVWFQGC